MAQSHEIPCWAKTLLHPIETVVITTIEVAVYPWSKVPALVYSNFNWDCTCGAATIEVAVHKSWNFTSWFPWRECCSNWSCYVQKTENFVQRSTLYTVLGCG